jgi:phosphohistidine swiveling domain-containing protein
MEINHLAQQYIYWPEVENKYQRNVDISKITLGEAHDMINDVSSQKKVHVADRVIRFYSLNEILAKVRQNENEILSTEAIALYDNYRQEIDDLSKKMFTYVFTICMMEARHNRDYGAINEKKESMKRELEGSEEYPFTSAGYAKLDADCDARMSEFKEEYLSEQYKQYFPDDAQFERYKLFHSFIEPLANLRDYDRDAVHSEFVPMLQKEPFNTLTVGEMLDFSKVLFAHNNFAGGYGGQAWSEIAAHGCKFVNGEINAEVFVDQAFSLEHNNGQIFNKDLVFRCDRRKSWYTYGMSHYQGENSCDDTQLLLNAQHQGQLLSVLSSEFSSECVREAQYEDEKGFFKSLEESGLVEKGFSYKSTLMEALENNLNNWQNIQSNFFERNPDFKEKIAPYLKSADPFNASVIMDNLRIDRHSTLELDDDNRKFYQIMNKVIADNMGQPALKASEEVSKEKPEFVFEYYDTKAVPAEKQVKEVLGNKAFNLMKMHEMDLPVPQATVFPATNSASFFNNKTEWNKQLRPALKELSDKMIDKKGNPVLCSVRSGSAISMPGMMDTILNVGIDDSNYDYFCKKMGKKVVNQCAIKFMNLFSKSYLNENFEFSDNFNKALFQFRTLLDKHGVEQNFKNQFPLNAQVQYKLCLHAVFKSWHSERATAYRNHHNIAHDIGTAAIVQEMVFGNLNNQSCTGVAFSRDCISGEKGIIGEFLVKAQGEDVVSGAVTPTNIKEMQAIFPNAYSQLVEICQRLEKETGDIQDIEFTIENNQLYILQKRKAVCSSMAQTRLSQELHEAGLLAKEEMLKSIKVDSLLPQDIVDYGTNSPSAKGLVANPGVLRGIVVHSEADIEKYQSLYDQHKNEKNFGWIFYAPLTSPEHAPIMIKTDAFVTGNGGFTSHAAILARSWKKPCVVGIGDAPQTLLNPGSIVTVDATNGKIYDNMLPLASNNNEQVKHIVDTLLEHYEVNLDNLQQDNPFQRVLDEINNNKTWMENYEACKFVELKKPETEKFLDLSSKIAIMILKHQQKVDNVVKPVVTETVTPVSEETAETVEASKKRLVV